MSENECHVYRDRESNSTYVGDPFVGVPVSRDIVEAVATQFHIKADSLARALREVQNTSVINVETLFTGFDPLPVGRSDEGLLYVLAEADGCWDTVADQIGLTEDGRDAVATAHDRQVREMVGDREVRGGSGFVVSCSEFPADAIDDIVAVVEKTRLTNRQATTWILSQYVPGSDAIARILSIPESVVQSELATVDRTTRRSAAETRTLDVPGPLTRLEPEPQSPTWMGLDWSRWFDLRDGKTLREELPRRPGLYRVRHTELPGLMYVGESGSEGGVRQRVGLGLSAGLSGSDRQTGDPHGAARPLQQITEIAGGNMEVSVTTPPISSNRRHRRAIEATLVAVCRREIGWTPMVQLNREPAEHVSSPHSELHRELRNIAERSSYSVPSWQPWRDVTAPHWLGLSWTESRPLSERDKIDSTGVYAFRLWREDQTGERWGQTVQEMGTTGSISSRLFKLQNGYGDDMRFSVVALDGLSTDTQRRSRELREVRHDIIGAHYLATGTLPEAQF
ncbi:hypothetical protein M0R88_15795 [Halorussus gelatinilyticus]|uniref:DUF8048 domain-containing protein n=1 Tax=Halorussus gelatinilyticus TaxID=2937524 RepID=A0A8U0IFV2_9EURY|nr:hypothetical protein [Halorussus gelatinilyticus]UPV99966.1 hypothetical protein M0R88_15795 [Halorussus gelatinilyticus]